MSDQSSTATSVRCKCHHTENQHEAERRYSPAFRAAIRPCLVGGCKCLRWVENRRRSDDV